MKRASLCAVVLLTGLDTGYFARSGNPGEGGPGLALAATAAQQKPELRRPQPTKANAEDLAAIEKLHQEDIVVTLPQDPKGIDIWTEDGLRLLPAGPAVWANPV